MKGNDYYRNAVGYSMVSFSFLLYCYCHFFFFLCKNITISRYPLRSSVPFFESVIDQNTVIQARKTDYLINIFNRDFTRHLFAIDDISVMNVKMIAFHLNLTISVSMISVIVGMGTTCVVENCVFVRYYTKTSRENVLKLNGKVFNFQKPTEI